MKNIWSLFTILSIATISLLFLSSCEDNSQNSDKLIDVDGFVINQKGDPIAGAQIKAFNNEKIFVQTTSNEAGGFSLKGIPESAKGLRISANAAEYNYFEVPYSTAQKMMVEGKLPILLSKDSCCNTVSIMVKDSVSGNILRGVEVKLAKFQSDWKQYKETNEDGVAIFENVCDAKYWIRVAKDGYLVYEKDFYLDSCQNLNLEVKITKREQDTCCNNKIKIWLKNQEGEAISNAKVKLWKDGKLLTYKMSEHGYVEFHELCAGKYAFSILAEHYIVSEFTQQFSCSDSVEVVQTLLKEKQEDCCNNKIKIWLKNQEGEPLDNIKVRLWQAGKNITTKYSENGYVIFDELCKGKYGFDIISDKYKPVEFSYEFTCEESKEVSKTLEKFGKDTCCEGRIKIWLKNGEGELIKNAKVKMWKNGEYINAKVAENGYVVFEGLCEAKYGFSIIAERYKGQEFDYALSCKDNKEFTKVLESTKPDSCYNAAIKIKVKDAENKEPIAGAKVIIKFKDQVIFEGVSNDDGYILKEGLVAPATYLIIVSKEGYNDIRFDMNIKECKLWQETASLSK
ncbi:MAG TPA: carboxypeptidase-like regulatory domain-containing protein [Candidatus Kapabacteria bacterium]|nr:carboxypeptidase-like regulatory domain-containing protein [Candidatus Kapabacteria bacterium]